MTPAYAAESLPAVAQRHGVTDPADVLRVPVPTRPPALFVVFTSFGYGHLMRSHRIARELVARAPVDAYVIGCHPSFSFGDGAAVHEIDLPAPVVIEKEALSELPAPPELQGLTPSMSMPELSALKSQLLLALARRLRPRAIVIDSFPFAQTPGRDAAECVETLAYLGAHSPGTLRCAGFRGVESLTRDAIQGTTCRRLIEQHLDLLFVYMDPREREGFFSAYPFLRPIAAKTRFVGYVAPPPAARRAEPRRGTRLLATFGAGVDSYRKVRLACDAFAILAAARPELTLDVVTGARLGEAHYRALSGDYGQLSGLHLATFAPGLAARFDEYDLVIGMGGYNTCVELYCADTRGIVLPRVSPTNQEQRHEALKFQAYGGIDHVIDSSATSPEGLARLIVRTLGAPPAIRAPLDIGGASATAEIVHDELSRRGAFAAPLARAAGRGLRAD